MSTDDPWATPRPGQGGQQPGPTSQQPGPTGEQPAHGQAPAYGQAPAHGGAPAHGQAPAHGGAPAYGQAPAYGGAAQYGPAPTGPPARPSTVKYAVWLMYAGAALATIGALLALTLQDQMRAAVRDELARTGGDVPEGLIDTTLQIGLVVGLVLGLVGAGLWIVNAVFCGRGHNWSRVLSTVLAGIFLLTFLFGLTQPNPGVTLLVNVLTALVAVGAIVLLWLRPSNDFFAAAGAARRAGR